MPPRSSKPRLCDLEPAGVARMVLRVAVRHARALFEVLRPWSGEQLRTQHGRQVALDGAPFFYAKVPGRKLVSELEPTVLGRSVRQLVCYAQTGERPPFDAAAMLHMVVGLTRLTWGANCPDQTVEVVELVAAAVTAREYLARKTPLTAAQVAAVGSVDAGHVNLLARSGRLSRLQHDCYDARSVASWLASREVLPDRNRCPDPAPAPDGDPLRPARKSGRKRSSSSRNVQK